MTKLYLHREGVGTLPSGTLPSTEQSSLAPDANLFDNEDGSENRAMDSTISASSQTTLTNTSTADTGAHNYYIARWVSPKLNMTSISANTWNLKFAATESNANANFPRNGAGALRICIYAWKPSDGTKYGNILDGNTAADFEEAGTTQTLIEGTFSGSAVSSLTADDVCIVFELWAVVTQAMGIGYTQTVAYDGTTESSTSNNAAFVETPQTLTFSSTLIERAINESISISPAVAKVATKFRTTSDSISISPAVARLYTAIRALPQSITISDAVAEAALKLRSMSDSISISDAVQRFRVFPRDIAESISLSPAITSIAIRVRGIAESVTISDSLTRLASFFRSINQSVSISDAVTRIKTAIKSISESVTISDSIARMKTAIRSISQSISLADAVERVFISGGSQLFEVACNVSISISDSTSRLKTAIRDIAQSITINDSVTKISLYLRTVAQNITISDSISKTLTRVRAIAESITISDSVSRLKTAIRGISETITLSDAVTRMKTAIINIAQAISISDVVTRFLPGAGQLFEVFINETISLGDSITLAIFKVIGGRPPGGNIFRRRFEEKMKKTWRVDWRKMLNKRLGIE